MSWAETSIRPKINCLITFALKFYKFPPPCSMPSTLLQVRLKLYFSSTYVVFLGFVTCVKPDWKCTMGRCLFLTRRRFNSSQINDVTLLQAVGAETRESRSSRKINWLKSHGVINQKQKQQSISSHIKHLFWIFFLMCFKPRMWMLMIAWSRNRSCARN